MRLELGVRIDTFLVVLQPLERLELAGGERSGGEWDIGCGGLSGRRDHSLGGYWGGRVQWGECVVLLRRRCLEG